MFVIDGSKMSTFGPKSGAAPAGAPAGGHVQGPLSASGVGAPESWVAASPEEPPLPPPLLELLVPLPEVPELELELLPEADVEPASGELPGEEEQASVAAPATPTERRTAAHLVDACAHLEYFSGGSAPLAVMGSRD
jgi:hypothetical protein